MKNINRAIIFVLNFLIIIHANAKETNRLAVVVNDKPIITSVEKNLDTEPKIKKIKKQLRIKVFTLSKNGK